METRITCPLGHSCERAVDGRLDRCAWYVQILGVNPQTGAQDDRWGCAIAWGPILAVQGAQATRGAQAAVEGVRNVIDRQGQGVAALVAATRRLRSLRSIEHDDQDRDTGDRG